MSIFWNDAGPHWHYVSIGMANVMGAELTFRLMASASDRGGDGTSFQHALARNAPTWPIKMLNMLARRVHRTGRPFGVGHWWEGAPGVLQPFSDIRFLVFARDPELGAVATGEGHIAFLQVVGVGPETVESMKRDELEQRGDATLDSLAAGNPLLVTENHSISSISDPG